MACAHSSSAWALYKYGFQSVRKCPRIWYMWFRTLLVAVLRIGTGLPKHGTMSEYRQGYTKRLNSIHNPSIPSILLHCNAKLHQTFIIFHVIKVKLECEKTSWQTDIPRKKTKNSSSEIKLEPCERRSKPLISRKVGITLNNQERL